MRSHMPTSCSDKHVSNVSHVPCYCFLKITKYRHTTFKFKVFFSLICSTGGFCEDKTHLIWRDPIKKLQMTLILITVASSPRKKL